MLDDFKEFVSMPPTNMPVVNNNSNIPQKKPKVKLWNMKKEDIIKYWGFLQPNLPIMPRPIDDAKKGSTFSEDGFRITGSRKYIDSVLSRIKDMLRFETNNTKLELVYRQQESKSKVPTNITIPSYVFYAHVREREGK